MATPPETWRSARAAYRSVVPISLRRTLSPILHAAWREAALAFYPAASVGCGGQPYSAATILGMFSAPTGLGMAARLCAAELRRAGIKVAGVDVSISQGAPTQPDLAPTFDEGEEKSATIFHFNPPGFASALLEHSKVRPLTGQRCVGYWVWELEQAPRSWRRWGRLVNEIWAPSRFAAGALRAVFDTPVHVIPHPAALGARPRLDPNCRIRARRALGISEDCFLGFSSFSMSSAMERKNPHATIRAFVDAFSCASRTSLLVMRCLDMNVFPEGARALRSLVASSKGLVRILDTPVAELSIESLYAACDCYVSLHRSEGFGLNMAEAMLARRPVVATGWSANLDFMDSASGVLIPAKLIDVSDPQRVYRSGRWAEPDHDAAVAGLRRLAQDSTFADAIAKAGEERCRQVLGGGAAARRLRLQDC